MNQRIRASWPRRAAVRGGHRAHSGARHTLGRRRGAVLLEVVVSISILLMSMGVVGLVFRNGQLNIHRAERITRAMLLTEQLLVELDTNILELDEQELVGWFDVEAEEGRCLATPCRPCILVRRSH